MTDTIEKQEPKKAKPGGLDVPTPPAKLEMPPGIPVALIRFVKPTQVPGKAVTPMLEAGTAKDRKRWDIELVPQLRCFRITFTPPDVGKPKVLMVHETRVDTWDPA